MLYMYLQAIMYSVYGMHVHLIY